MNYKRISAELARRLFSQAAFLHYIANQYCTPDLFAEAYTSLALNRMPGEKISVDDIEEQAWNDLLESHGEDITNQVIQWASGVIRKELKQRVSVLLDDYLKDSREESAA